MRVALLTNFIPPYRVPLFQALARKVGALRVFISTRIESNRQWRVEWGEIDVTVQRTLTFHRVWKTERFEYPYEMHVPLDTIPQLSRFRPDVIITGEMGSRSLQAVLYGHATGTPVVLWATLADHLEDSRGRARAVFRRRLLRRVARVVVNGRSGEKYVLRMGVPRERITIIPQTTDLAPFLALPLTRLGARTFLVVGALTELKGVDILLRALSRFDRVIHVVIVGDGPQRAELQSMALPGNVHVEWAGHVEYGDLPGWYAKGGILVFPTMGDEWGLVVNEALAAGMPVLGSMYSQAVQDLIEDGENGWQFRPDSEADISAALERAMNTNDEELARMRYAARNSIEQLDPDAIAVRFAEVCRDVGRVALGA